MEKERLLQEVREILKRGNFTIGEPLIPSVSFDLIARREELLLILKLLVNIDALRNEVARELKILGKELGGTPLIIGKKSASGSMLDGVIYSRHGIPTISLPTFRDFILEDIYPLVYSSPGGLYVRINGEILREIRERRGISLGELAKIAGVSRKAIQLYEYGMSAAVDIALKLEEYLGEELIEPLNLAEFGKLEEERYDIMALMRKDPEMGFIYRKLINMGYDVYLTLKCPFEALSRDKTDLFLTGIGREMNTLRYKAINLKILTRVFRRNAFIIVEKLRTEEMEGIPLIEKEELMEMEHREEIKKLVRERSAI